MSSPTARNRRQLQGDRSREDILDVASQLMASRGYDGTSISALAKGSGLPASSIYWHFGSKEGVLKAVMERGAARFAAETSLDDVPRDGSPRDKVTWVLQRAARLIEESPEFLRLQTILLLSAPTGDTNDAVGRLRQRQREGLRDALALCFAEPGEPPAIEIADRLIDIAAATFEGAFLAAQAGSTTHSETLAKLADLLVRMAEDEQSGTAP
jgi:AcrR family transcriptional regulator